MRSEHWDIAISLGLMRPSCALIRIDTTTRDTIRLDVNGIDDARKSVEPYSHTVATTATALEYIFHRNCCVFHESPS